MKQIYTSKRFWTGLIALITCIGLLATGEKSLSDNGFLTEIFMTVISFIQTVVALTSKSEVKIGGVSLNGQ